MTLLIIYATVSIFFSFLCSILEAVLLSITPTFINLKKSEGFEFANELETLKNLNLPDMDQMTNLLKKFNQKGTLEAKLKGLGNYIIKTLRK